MQAKVVEGEAECEKLHSDISNLGTRLDEYKEREYEFTQKISSLNSNIQVCFFVTISLMLTKIAGEHQRIQQLEG